MDGPITGTIEVTDEGWLHIRLDTLLPHCRYGSVAAIDDAIDRLLKSCPGTRMRYERAFLFIDEHSDESARRVFDQDNKAWKAIPNAMKGHVFLDDDQYTLSVCLLSERSSEAATHIWVTAWEDGFRYLRQRTNPLGLTPRWFSKVLFWRKYF